MADEINPNLNLIGPEVGGSLNTWGSKLNENFAILDSAVAERLRKNGDSMTGALGIVAGTAAAPSLFFTGDNTGLFQPAANQLGISIDGVSRIVISSTTTAIQGNVSYTGTLTGGTGVIDIGAGQIYKDALGKIGIATANPVRRLEVVENSSGLVAQFKSTSGTTSAICFANTAANADADQIRIGSAGTSLVLSTAFLPRLEINSAGHLGLAVTPSAWGGTAKAFQIASGAFLMGTATASQSIVGANAYFDGTQFRYIASALPASYMQQLSGATSWFTAPSGTAGTPITFTQAMTLTQGGFFKASNTGVYVNAAGGFHEFNGSDSGETVFINTTSTTSIAAHTRLPIGSTGFHYLGELLGTGAVYRVLANGNVQNTNNSYGAISDAKLKENVTDVGSYLDRFMQVRFRNFNFIGSDLKQFGVIAQELETVFPGLVDESPDFEQVTRTRTVEVPAVDEVLDENGEVVTPAQPASTVEEEYTESVPTGTFTKSVKYSVLAQIQGKVIQEAVKRIEALESGANTSELVALVKAQTRALQAQQSTIAQLEQRVAALES